MFGSSSCLSARICAVILGVCAVTGAVEVPVRGGASRFLVHSQCAAAIDAASEFGDDEHIRRLPESRPAIDLLAPTGTRRRTPPEPQRTERREATVDPDADATARADDAAEGTDDTGRQIGLERMGAPATETVADPTAETRPRAETPVPTPPDARAAVPENREPAVTDDVVPVEVPEERIRRAQLGLHNEWVLLFGHEADKTATLHELDFDITALLRSPQLQFMTYRDGVGVPTSIREERTRIERGFREDVHRLNAQIQEGLIELGADYTPASDRQLINAFILMDAQVSWTGPTRELLRKLTEIHEMSSESYIQDQENELALGSLQDGLATWLRRFVFRLTAGNVTRPEAWDPMRVYTDRLERENKESLVELVERGVLDRDLLRLFHAGDFALLDAIRELHARMTLSGKTPLSIPARIALKALVAALQDVEGQVLREHADAEWRNRRGRRRDESPEYPIITSFDPRAERGVAAEADEARFDVETAEGRVSVDGVAYRQRLEVIFFGLLRGLCQNDRMRAEIHRYGDNLGIALLRLRQAERALAAEKRKYTQMEQAATIARHAVSMVALPRRAGGQILPDSIACDGWIKQLPPNLREMGLMVIDYHGGYEDPFTNQWVPLNGRTAREVLGLIPSGEEREQIIASQFFSRERINAARRLAGVFFLEGLRDSVREQVEEKKGVARWSVVAERAEAVKKVALGQAVGATVDYLGRETPLAELVRAADLQKEAEGKPTAKPISEEICREECPLPPAEITARNVLDVWNQTVLGPVPQGNQGYRREATDGFITTLRLPDIHEAALSRSNTILTAIFERLDDIAWHVYAANVQARKARNEARAAATTPAAMDAAETEFRARLQRDYLAPTQQVQSFFTKFHRALRTAFVEAAVERKSQGRPVPGAPAGTDEEGGDEAGAADGETAAAAVLTPGEITRAKQEADVTLLHLLTPYEALVWCILQGETNTNQRFLNDLARHILRQSQNWNGQRALDGARIRRLPTRRDFMVAAGTSVATIGLSYAVVRLMRWLGGDDGERATGDAEKDDGKTETPAGPAPEKPEGEDTEETTRTPEEG